MSRTAPLLLALALLAPGIVAAHDHSPPDRRSVTVSGEGEVSAKPDRARLALSVDNLSTDVKSAEAEVNRVTRAYLAQAKSLGVKDEQISTAGMTLNPEYVWDDKARKQTLAGYRARRQITVTVDNLDKLGDLILAATSAGVNQINPPVLESSKAKELSRQALVKAAEDARAKAQLLADTLGVKLGTVRSLSASDSSAAPPPRPVMFMAKAMAAAPADESGNDQMGFAAGEIKFSASVNAEFDLIAQ
ncbi:MAG: SIMPL domain-containing protein [Stenotrophobium sp.]